MASVYQEDSVPAAYMRVVRHGRAWSLEGDIGLQQQLGWTVGSEIDAYHEEERLWVPFKTHHRFNIPGIGYSLYLKKPGVICTPLFPALRSHMFPHVPFLRKEETLLHYLKRRNDD